MGAGAPAREKKELVMFERTIIRRIARSWLLVAVLTVLAATALSGPVAVAQRPAKPTVVLVHGAFADASGWSGEIQRLQGSGYRVLAPANPLRGVDSDAAYIKAFLATIKGPIVLVGHSYGGFVITDAALGNPNVKALVYVAGFAPDQGETIAGIEQLAPGGQVGPKTLTIRTYPAPDGSAAQEGYITPSVFRHVFAADVPAKTAAVMAVSQRPAALATLGQPSGAPAWKSIPSWYLVPGRDNAIGTRVERIMAKRMNAHTTEVKGASHAVLVSRPRETTAVILAAARAAAK